MGNGKDFAFLVTGLSTDIWVFNHWYLASGEQSLVQDQLQDLQFSLENQVAEVAKCVAECQLWTVHEPFGPGHGGPVQALMTSRLDYHYMLCIGWRMSWRMGCKLQLVQNMVVQVVTGARRFDSAGPLLQQLY